MEKTKAAPKSGLKYALADPLKKMYVGKVLPGQIPDIQDGFAPTQNQRSHEGQKHGRDGDQEYIRLDPSGVSQQSQGVAALDKRSFNEVSRPVPRHGYFFQNDTCRQQFPVIHVLGADQANLISLTQQFHEGDDAVMQCRLVQGAAGNDNNFLANGQVFHVRSCLQPISSDTDRAADVPAVPSSTLQLPCGHA